MATTTDPGTVAKNPAVLKRFLFIGPTGAGKLLFEILYNYDPIFIL